MWLRYYGSTIPRLANSRTRLVWTELDAVTYATLTCSGPSQTSSVGFGTPAWEEVAASDTAVVVLRRDAGLLLNVSAQTPFGPPSPGSYLRVAYPADGGTSFPVLFGDATSLKVHDVAVTGAIGAPVDIATNCTLVPGAESLAALPGGVAVLYPSQICSAGTKPSGVLLSTSFSSQVAVLQAPPITLFSGALVSDDNLLHVVWTLASAVHQASYTAPAQLRGPTPIGSGAFTVKALLLAPNGELTLFGNYASSGAQLGGFALAYDGGTNLFVAQLRSDGGVRAVRAWPQGGAQIAQNAVWIGSQLILLATCDAQSVAAPCKPDAGAVLFAINPF